jgi:hypothetical protein
MHSTTSTAIAMAALLAGSAALRSKQVHAQAYEQGSGDPCASAPTSSSPFGMLVNVLVQQQRQAACAAQRRAQWEEYKAKQKAAKDAADASAAQKQAAQAEAARAHAQAEDKARADQAAAEARAARKKAQQRELARNEARRSAEHKRLRHLALMQAENAPDNHCRDPKLAKAVIEGWNGLDTMKAADVRTIDIEHLTTVSFAPQTMSFSCHGVFVTSKGWKVAGTVTVKKNIADEAMFVWERDGDQDLSMYETPAPVDASSPEMGSQTKVFGQSPTLTQVNAQGSR